MVFAILLTALFFGTCEVNPQCGLEDAMASAFQQTPTQGSAQKDADAQVPNKECLPFCYVGFT